MCCLLSRQIFGRRGACPPARRPRRELRSARRLEARPGPAAAHRYRGSSLRCPPHRRCGATTVHRHRDQASQAPLRPPIGGLSFVCCPAKPYAGFAVRAPSVRRRAIVADSMSVPTHTYIKGPGASPIRNPSSNQVSRKRPKKPHMHLAAHVISRCGDSVWMRTVMRPKKNASGSGMSTPRTVKTAR